MAITSFDILSCDKIPTKSSCSTNSSKGGNSCRLLKMNFATDGMGGLPVTPSKSSKTKKNNSKSPYLTGDRVQLLSRVTEKRLVQKKTTDFVSSFPLAVNIYKANSDEFKSSKKANKKVKKSVLTLPNDPAPVPQVCTVSDMNDSEYCDQTDEVRKQKAIKKRIPIKNTKKARVREKDFEFYDRDAKYCSQLNINLDCSSHDMMKNFNGDGKGVSNKKKTIAALNKPQTGNNLNDVWAVLRNINRFQFRPSPPMSEESIIPIKKKVQKRRNRKDTRVIETCRTEEFAYISSYEVDEKTPRSFSPSSSIDRITVIDKQNEFSKICEEFEKRLLNTHNFLKDSNNTKSRIRKNKIQCRNAKNNVRALGNVVPKDNKQLVPLKKKKNLNFKSTDQQNKSYPTNSSSGNKDSLLGADHLHISDNSDILSHKTPDESVFPISSSFIYSDHSGSSKAEFPDKIKLLKEKTSMTKVFPEKSCSQIKGIPRVVLGNEQETNINSVAPKRFDSQKRKPRLVTTMPSSCIMPKLTQTEIKRRLAHIRYPLVILGKDQVSTNIQVLNDDPPQFNGLDDHIWPFMVEWSEDRTFNKGDNATKDLNRNSLNRKCNYYLSEPNSSKSRKPNIEEATYRQLGFKEKKQANNDCASKKKAEPKRPTPCSEIADKLLQSTKKQKSIVHLKDKMLNFLYKKSSSRNVINENHQNDENDDRQSKHFIAENKVDADFDYVTTEVGMRSVVEPVEPNQLPKKRAVPNPLPAILSNKRTLHYAYPWAKAKWASDFIENVIKKIKSGVYYTQDHKDVSRKYQADMKEVSVQAGSSCDSSDSTQTNDSVTNLVPEVTITAKQNNYLSIPGFNNTLPRLELKTLNKNQIAVKHCVTNVMLQFDITVPAKNNQSTTSISKSTPLIPIEVTESHTKIYKCKTTILNAMLPAELCSILPRMMRTILNSNHNADRPAALCPGKTDSCLSTISELTRYETLDDVGSVASLNMTPEIKNVLEGRFSNKITCSKIRFTSKINVIASYNYDLVIELLPKISLKDLSRLEIIPRVFGLNNTKETYSEIPFNSSHELLSREVTDMQNPTCKAMQVYTGRENRLSAAFKPYDLLGMIESIVTNHNLVINLNLASYFDMLKSQYDGKNIEINMSIKNDTGFEKNMLVTITNLKIDSLYNASPKVNNRKNHTIRNYHTRRNTHMNCIEYMNTSHVNKPENTGTNQVTSIKNKRKGFYKLYRKCKSTSNIPSPEKCVNTPLSKVYTLDDFFQILGSKKMLCGVFDGYSAKKILSSITEMKNWITEINPRQALLILLLTNKKDTPNLVRFRPLILQGIAVNRITRATELDMEIEVIERENLNKFSQYEGISYLPESVTNYDNLLEELYWIAKTTASDYQRPFDESSERLLKSLLEKRKKLNPSYLRVMARYVGLGLLKSPTKS